MLYAPFILLLRVPESILQVLRLFSSASEPPLYRISKEKNSTNFAEMPRCRCRHMMTGCTSNFEMVLGHNIAPFDSLAPSVIIVQSKKNRLILSEYKNITKLAITNEVEAKNFL